MVPVFVDYLTVLEIRKFLTKNKTSIVKCVFSIDCEKVLVMKKTIKFQTEEKRINSVAEGVRNQPDLYHSQCSSHILRINTDDSVTLFKLNIDGSTTEKTFYLPLKDMLREGKNTLSFCDEGWLEISEEEFSKDSDSLQSVMNKVELKAIQPQRSKVMFLVSLSDEDKFFALDMNGEDYPLLMTEEQRGRMKRLSKPRDLFRTVYPQSVRVANIDSGTYPLRAVNSSPTTILTRTRSGKDNVYVTYLETQDPSEWDLVFASWQLGGSLGPSEDYIESEVVPTLRIGRNPTINVKDIASVQVIVPYSTFIIVTKSNDVYLHRFWDELFAAVVIKAGWEGPSFYEISSGEISVYSTFWKLEKKKERPVIDGDFLAPKSEEKKRPVMDGEFITQPPDEKRKRRRIEFKKTSGRSMEGMETSCWEYICEVVGNVGQKITHKHPQMTQTNRDIWMTIKEMPPCRRQQEMLTCIRKNPPVITCGESLSQWLLDFGALLGVSIQ